MKNEVTHSFLIVCGRCHNRHMIEIDLIRKNRAGDSHFVH